MLENILIGLALFVIAICGLLVISKLPDKDHLLSATPPTDDDKERDFVCLHLGPRGSIATCRGVTVRATRINEGNE